MPPSTSYRYLGTAAVGATLAFTLPASMARAEVTRTGREPWYQQTTADIGQAKALFDRAVGEHLQLLRGDARDLYDQALTLWDNPDIRWNLAIVLEDLGQYLHAHRELERAARWGAALGSERLHDVHDRMTALESHHLSRIDASCAESATDLTLDGRPWFRGAGLQSMLVEPGEHYVVARKAGFFPVERSIAVVAGQAARLDLPMDEDRLIKTRRWAAWKPWATVSAGFAITMTGVLLEREAFSQRDSAAASLSGTCVASTGCPPTPAPSSYGRAVTEHQMALGALVAGGATMAVGLALVWINQVQVHRTAPRRFGAIEIAPILSTNQVGITTQRQF